MEEGTSEPLKFLKAALVAVFQILAVAAAIWLVVDRMDDRPASKVRKFLEEDRKNSMPAR